MISKYFNTLKSEIDSYSHIIENYQIGEKIYSNVRGFIEGEFWFTDESRLSFAEVKDIELIAKIKYHYHYMDNEDNLIFRYDNARHFKDLKTFPHHKHLLEKVIECSEPELINILSEIEFNVLKNKAKHSI